MNLHLTDNGVANTPLAPSGKPMQITPGLIVVHGVLLTTLTFIILGVVDYFFHQQHMRQMLTALVPYPGAILLGTVIGFPFFVFGELCWWVRRRICKENESSEDFIQARSTAGYAVHSFFSGFPEEVLLRGCIQAFAGIWIASALFAAMHITSKRAVPYAVTTFFYGLILGAIYLYTGNLWVSIMCHVVNNFLTFTVGKRFRALLPA